MTRPCLTVGHISSTTVDPERCTYCGEPLDLTSVAVLIAAGRLRAGDVLGALRVLEATP